MAKHLNRHFEEHYAQCREETSPILVVLLLFFEEIVIHSCKSWMKNIYAQVNLNLLC